MQHITMFDLTLGLLMELVKTNATAQCRTYLDTCEGMSKLGYEASARMQTGAALSSAPAVLNSALRCTDHCKIRLNT